MSRKKGYVTCLGSLLSSVGDLVPAADDGVISVRPEGDPNDVWEVLDEGDVNDIHE